MKTTELTAYAREERGKRSLKDLRKEGKIPAVIYHNREATHITLDYKTSKEVVFTPDTYIVKLNIDGGESADTIIREVQFHPVKDTIQHIDFLQVTGDKDVILSLPIKLTGSPAGVAKGGKLLQKLRKLKVKGVPTQLPDYVEVDVAELDLGQTRKVGEADFGDIKVLTSPSAGVASIEIPRSLRSAGATTADAGSAPADGGDAAEGDE